MKLVSYLGVSSLLSIVAGGCRFSSKRGVNKPKGMPLLDLNRGAVAHATPRHNLTNLNASGPGGKIAIFPPIEVRANSNALSIRRLLCA
jgi:hypothetical protein